MNYQNYQKLMLLTSSDTKRTLMIYSCLQILSNWFQYIRSVYATAINFSCIITLDYTKFCVVRYYIWYIFKTFNPTPLCAFLELFNNTILEFLKIYIFSMKMEWSIFIFLVNIYWHKNTWFIYSLSATGRTRKL